MFQFPGLMINVVFSECTVPSQKAFPSSPLKCSVAKCFCFSLRCHAEEQALYSVLSQRGEEASADRHIGK